MSPLERVRLSVATCSFAMILVGAWLFDSWFFAIFGSWCYANQLWLGALERRR